MKKNLLSTLLLVLIYCSSQAQFWLPMPEQAKLFEGRTLVVESGDFECNPNMVEHLKKHWKLGNTIIGKTTDEITMMLTPADAKKYLVLTGDVRQEHKKSQGKTLHHEVFAIAIYPGEHAGHRNQLDIDREWICKVSLPSCLVSEEEVLFISQFFANQVHAVSNGLHSSNRVKSTIPKEETLKLKELTLLMPSDLLDVEQSAREKYYPYPVEIVDKSAIKSAVSKAESGKAYLTVIWDDKHFHWSIVAVEAASGQILAVARCENFKSNVVKKKYKSEGEFLTIFRSKRKVNLDDVKHLGKAVSKASEVH